MPQSDGKTTPTMPGVVQVCEYENCPDEAAVAYIGEAGDIYLCDEHGAKGGVPMCRACNYAKHVCPGCGESVAHGVTVCGACAEGES